MKNLIKLSKGLSGRRDIIVLNNNDIKISAINFINKVNFIKPY